MRDKSTEVTRCVGTAFRLAATSLRFVLLSLGLVWAGGWAPVHAETDGGWDAVFTCQFPSYGTVVIDTRAESRSITVDGRTYPAQTGSYFFQGTEDAPTVEGAPIVIFFAPTFEEWTYLGETSADCSRADAALGE